MPGNNEFVVVLRLMADQFKTELLASKGAIGAFNDFLKKRHMIRPFARGKTHPRCMSCTSGSRLISMLMYWKGEPYTVDISRRLVSG